MLVEPRDALDADWTVTHPAVATRLRVREGPLTIAWITSPPGRESGGHQNMFRFIKVAEAAGHRCRIYLYDTQHTNTSIAAIRGMLATADAYSHLDASIEAYERDRGVADDTTTILATGWETAYAAFLDRSPARRFYFVQDFEPAFYPAGTEHVLAENTYRFGFHGMTAGAWLEKMLRANYGMHSDHYDFGADRLRYRVENVGTRAGVFFYARPATPRRAFDLGVMGLSLFAAQHPEAIIHVAGEKVSPARVPFAHVNHGAMELSQLNTLYNDCATGLVLSLTNMSLLPLELLAAGVTPVVNDAPNNRLVADNSRMRWAPLAPAALARELSAAYSNGRDGSQALANAAVLPATDWEGPGKQFLSALEKEMRR